MVFPQYENACGLPDGAHKQMQMDINDICEVSHLFKREIGKTARVAIYRAFYVCPLDVRIVTRNTFQKFIIA